ncbi:MATE family efflux transporter [Actinomadura sp. SCN-SB]|uniref:MATE family efflux transporter n=1 Tax=Actinomadura sp. SCN-SB TaxID=3373092 RepID=UPI003751DEC5
MPRPSRPGSGVRAEIRRLALPLAAGGLISVLAQTLIVMALGRAGDTELYLRSLYMPVAFGFAAVCEGIGIATQVAAARAHGRGDRDQEAHLGAGFLLLGAVWMTIAVCALLVCAPLVADVMDVSADQSGRFESFLRWTALANIVRIVPVVGAGILRGRGRAGMATVVTGAAATTEVAVVAGLAGAAGLGVFSVPWAILAEAAVGACLLLAMGRRSLPPSLRAHPDVRSAASLLARVGLPVAASFGLLSSFSLAALWVLAPLGAHLQAAYSTAYTVQMLVIVPTIALGSATAIVMNHRIGSGRHQELRAAFRAGAQLTLLWYTVVALIIWAAAGPLARIVSGASTVAPLVERYLELIGPTLPLLCLVLMALTVLEQLGEGSLALTLNIVYFATVICLGAALVEPGGAHDTFFWIIVGANVVGAPVVVPLTVWRVRLIGAKELGTCER